MSELSLHISPHVKAKSTVGSIMWTVVLALVPALVASIVIFGMRALYITLTAILSAAAAEFAVRLFRTEKNLTITDGSAIITGMLLAFNLPPSLPLWMVATGSVVAIVVGKEVFGGIGQNIFNPALVGRAFLLASWPMDMTTWHTPAAFKQAGLDAVTSATPLYILKDRLDTALPSMWQLFVGDRGGCLGETCIAALLVGAAVLLITKVITWHIPVSYIATTAILTALFMNRQDILGPAQWLYYLMSGGLVLGAFFMATDYPTSPMSAKGHIVFGIGCGTLTFLIRKFGGYPEGVCYSILIMNAAVPLIDRYTRPKGMGYVKEKA